MLFRILDCPCISLQWTGQGLLALWLPWSKEGATSVPVISTEVDSSHQCKAPRTAAPGCGTCSAVRIRLSDPGLKAIY